MAAGCNGQHSSFLDHFLFMIPQRWIHLSILRRAGLTSPVVQSSGGQWGGVPTGYIDVLDYFQVQFTAKSGFEPKDLEITDIEFDVANFSPIRRVTNVYLAYSFNADFSDSTIVYDYPEANIYAALLASPMNLDYTFSFPHRSSFGSNHLL